MTISELTKDLTQTQYERLLTNIAKAIGTQRRFITIVKADNRTDYIRYTVTRKGTVYPYIIDMYLDGTLRWNWGLVI